MLACSSAPNQSSRTLQTRSRTAGDILAPLYTPGASSSMHEARNPRIRSETLRVTTTVIDMEKLLDPVNHGRDEFLPPKPPRGFVTDLALQGHPGLFLD